jgi:aminocarboxymuconate-semialdehyde decarboxylase
MKIDVHAHIVDRAYIEALSALKGLTASAGAKGQILLRHGNHTYAWYREEMFDIGSRLRDMDRLGIDRRILSLSTPNVYEWKETSQIAMARQINDALARILRAHPDRFSGLASLPIGAGADAALAELERCVSELGMAGVALGSNVGGMALDDPCLDPIWSRINLLRLPVFEHPMFPVNTAGMEAYELPLRVGFVFDTTLALTRMIYSGVFARYADFPFVVAHTGGALLTILERLDNGYRLFPDCREKINELPSVYAKRLYFDSCSFYRPALRMALEIVGPEHILWGSDDPYIGASAEHVESLDLPEADKRLMLGGNAARLFHLAAA